MNPPGPILDYAGARPIQERRNRGRYSLPVALLLLLSTLAGAGSLLLGLLCIADEPLDGGMLMAAGALLCLAVLRELSRQEPRLTRAFFQIALAISAQATLAVALLRTQLPSAQAAVARLPYIDERGYVHASDEARRESRLESALELNIAAGAAALLLLGYVGIRMIRHPSFQ